MTTIPTTTPAAPTASIRAVIPTAPSDPVGGPRSSLTVADRTIRQFRRTPQLIVVGALTSAMFLLIFRYVFGGAIDTGGVSYANFLISGLCAVAGLFAGGVVGVAEGGTVSVTVEGEIVTVTTSAGQSSSDVAAALAAAINANLTLETAGISAVANDFRVYTNGAIGTTDIADPGLSLALPSGVPAAPAWGLVAMAALLLLAVAARSLRRAAT